MYNVCMSDYLFYHFKVYYVKGYLFYPLQENVRRKRRKGKMDELVGVMSR